MAEPSKRPIARRAVIATGLLVWPVAWIYVRAFHFSGTPPAEFEFLGIPVMMLICYVIVFDVVAARWVSLRVGLTLALIALQWGCILAILMWPPHAASR
jgi:hypothetical protein